MAEPIVIAQHRQRGFDGGRALLVERLRVDMDNCASVVAANTNRTAHEIRQHLFEDGAAVISIQAGG
jgi:hypothetical protein